MGTNECLRHLPSCGTFHRVPVLITVLSAGFSFSSFVFCGFSVERAASHYKSGTLKERLHGAI